MEGEAVDGSWVCSESRADSFAAEGSDVGDDTKESRRDDSEIFNLSTWGGWELLFLKWVRLGEGRFF